MEKSPSERKPNRFFRGAIIRAAIGEALGWNKPPRQEDNEPIGIGAMDAGQMTIFNPDHWDNWERGANGQVSETNSLPPTEED